MNPDSIAFLSSDTPESREAAAVLSALYGQEAIEEAETIVALGGDGFMLQTLHRFMNTGKQIYGMNRGSVGFLMNDFREDGLRERIAAAEAETIRPLRMLTEDMNGEVAEAFAINEVSLFRQSYQAAKIAIHVDGKERLAELICDGVLLATPAGSTAYNLSAQGPIIPIDAPLLALTPVSPFRPRRWRGAILPDSTEIAFRVLEPKKRPVSAVADQREVRDVATVNVCLDTSQTLSLMFDPEHALDERIYREQFIV